ncbi:uncharacterized protein LTR77_007963 [Saxophila tyrrhenica]|uniref:MFS transporter n=1 Tax=Saxophila tyrrhenica TaxID=1690608 RepID=A0AAV9P3D8_9PEZI|nr:hypothetical protein LTR77_007963 [Saxophila tyrrhenica]
MSLVQRVTPIEGSDFEPPAQLEGLFNPQSTPRTQGYGTITTPNNYSLHHRPSVSHSLRHKRSLRTVLSYDAFPKPEEPSQATNPSGGVTAYKVSTARRIAQVCFTVLACWLASGIVFGFAALKPVLVDTGVYRQYCTAEELAEDIDVCYEQELRMNFFFAIASTTCNVSALPVGTILDRYGPRVAAVIGSICLAIGTLLMAFAFYIPEFDGYIVGNIFLALGGTFIFVPSFSIANAFPKASGLIVATVTGAFDASAAVFLFYRLSYEASGGTFTPEKFFFGYLIVPIFIFVGQFTLMNEDAYKTVPQYEAKLEKEQDATRDVHDSDEDMSENEVRKLRNKRRFHRESKIQEIDRLLGDADERHQREEKQEDRLIKSGVWGVLHGKTATEQILTPWFVLITLLTVLQMLRMNFFIATIKAQYRAMLGSRILARRINMFFDVALPIGGIAATPFIGLLLDHTSTATMLSVLVALITAVGVVGSLPYLWAGYLNVILFVLLRPLYYSAMSDYAAKVFGFATFGRVYGCIIALSGLVNLFQPAIDAMDHDIFDDNPIPVNVVFAALAFVFGVALVAYVWWQGRKVTQAQEAQMAEYERYRIIPEEDDEISNLNLRS